MSTGTSRSSGSRGRRTPILGTPSSQRLSLVPSSPTPPVTSALTPRALLQRHPLPCAAHLHTPTPPPPGLANNKPLLLYKTSQTCKVRAESLQLTSDGRLVTVGPSLVVPDTYTGWFSIVDSRGCRAARYSSVGAAVRGQQGVCFLTRHDLPAYTTVGGSHGSAPASYRSGAVRGGEVLRVLGVQRGTGAEGRLAKCVNYKKQVVLVPLRATGRFYLTAERDSRSTEKVFLTKQLLHSFQLPLTVRLVCGYMPKAPCSFTGILRLTHCEEESVVLACTMTSRVDATLMEMDVTSTFLLSPILDPMFCKTPLYLKTLSYCDDEADSWQRQIKVTHHVTERRSRSLTRSFSDKFVDVPMTGYRPSSLSSLSSLDRAMPIKPRLTHSASDNHLGKLASKVKRIKEAKTKENSCKKEVNGETAWDASSRLPQQIMCPETKLFEKHRKMSKQNTYVKEINRKNRPLPDPHEKENISSHKNSKMSFRESLNSLRKYRRNNKNRPLPNPDEANSEDEEELSFQMPKFIATSRERLEYGRVLDDISPPPDRVLERESADEDDTENLYSEIDDCFPTGNDTEASDEEVDSATYSNEYSSRANSIDTDLSRTNTGLVTFYGRTSRSHEVAALVHARATQDDDAFSDNEGDNDHYSALTVHDELQSDHYATLTMDDEEGRQNKPANKENSNNKWRKNQKKRELDTISDRSVLSDNFCDSLEDVSTASLTDDTKVGDELKTFLDSDGTIRKKYIVRQRKCNIYQTVNEAKDEKVFTDDVNELKSDPANHTEQEIECSRSDGTENQGEIPRANCNSSESCSPYTSMITIGDTESIAKKISISILTGGETDAAEANCQNALPGTPRPTLASLISTPNLCEAQNDSAAIQMEGNTIRIRVLDDVTATTAREAVSEHRAPCGSVLRKSSSVSSISILMEDNADELLLCGSDSLAVKDKADPSHLCCPSVATITEDVDDIDVCSDMRFNSGECTTVAVADGDHTSAKINSDAKPDVEGEKDGKGDPTEKNPETPCLGHTKCTDVLSSGKEVTVNGDDPDQRLREGDRKSVDSGNGSDEVEDQEYSFDADSLADESEAEGQLSPTDESEPEAYESIKDDGESKSFEDDALQDVLQKCLQNVTFRELFDQGAPKDTNLEREEFDMNIMEPIPEEDSEFSDCSEDSFPSLNDSLNKSFVAEDDCGTLPDTKEQAITTSQQIVLETPITQKISRLVFPADEIPAKQDPPPHEPPVYTPLEEFQSAVTPLLPFQRTSSVRTLASYGNIIKTMDISEESHTINASSTENPCFDTGKFENELHMNQGKESLLKCFYNSPICELSDYNVLEKPAHTTVTSSDTTTAATKRPPGQMFVTTQEIVLSSLKTHHTRDSIY